MKGIVVVEAPASVVVNVDVKVNGTVRCLFLSCILAHDGIK